MLLEFKKDVQSNFFKFINFLTAFLIMDGNSCKIVKPEYYCILKIFMFALNFKIILE